MSDHPTNHGVRRRALARLAPCELLDRLGIPQSNRAIGAALAKHWSPGSVAEFGAAGTKCVAGGARTPADMLSAPTRRPRDR